MKVKRKPKKPKTSELLKRNKIKQFDSYSLSSKLKNTVLIFYNHDFFIMS